MFDANLLFTLLAHQGGWDEFLLVGGPLLVVLLVLLFATRRLNKPSGEDEPGSDSDEPSDGHEAGTDSGEPPSDDHEAG